MSELSATPHEPTLFASRFPLSETGKESLSKTFMSQYQACIELAKQVLESVQQCSSERTQQHSSKCYLLMSLEPDDTFEQLRSSLARSMMLSIDYVEFVDSSFDKDLLQHERISQLAAAYDAYVGIRVDLHDRTFDHIDTMYCGTETAGITNKWRRMYDLSLEILTNALQRFVADGKEQTQTTPSVT